MRRRLAVGLLVLILTTPSWVPAWAYGQDTPRDARKLFLLGVDQAKRGDWTQACASFEHAYRVTREASALFNLAGAQLRIGLMLESNANYHRFLLMRDPRITSAHRDAAEKQLAKIEAQIPRLRLHIEGLEPEDRVIIDRQRLYPPDLDLEQWLNPGLHVITVYRRNGTSESHRLTVLQSEHKVLAISLR